MDSRQRSESPRLWVSYPWAGREEKDLTWVISMLRESNIEVSYNSIQLQPNMQLWQRIIQRLTSIDIDGWLYVLTHQFMACPNGADELVVAIEKALLCKGQDFPTVGLLYGIDARHLPRTIRMRPCLSAWDPNWRQQVSQALRRNAPDPRVTRVTKDTRYIWRIHSSHGGNPLRTAIEVGTHGTESIPYWRFAIPKSSQPIEWGVGTPCGGSISPIRFAVAKGSGIYGNLDANWFGAANAVSNHESAYVVFSGALPEFICFGPAKDAFGPPGQMEILPMSLMRR